MEILSNIIKSIIFGIVEGITEWLPVSSTGHMIILEKLLSLDMSSKVLSLFFVVIQLGAIAAVLIFYWNKIWPFKRVENKTIVDKRSISLWINIIISCIPAAIVGILFDDFIEKHFYNYRFVAFMLIIVGVLFIIIENAIKNKKSYINDLTKITPMYALILGISQVIAAIFPGTSRSGALIICALLLGFSRIVAVEYAFLLGIPVMCGASLLKIVSFIKDGYSATGLEIVYIIIGVIVAFIVSMLTIINLLNYLKNHNFKIFGYYRILLGISIILLFRFVL